MVPVLFLSHHGAWSAGDVAGFEEAAAARLIAAGLAAPYKPAAADASAPAAPSEGAGQTSPQALPPEAPAEEPAPAKRKGRR